MMRRYVALNVGVLAEESAVEAEESKSPKRVWNRTPSTITRRQIRFVHHSAEHLREPLYDIMVIDDGSIYPQNTNLNIICCYCAANVGACNLNRLKVDFVASAFRRRLARLSLSRTFV